MGQPGFGGALDTPRTNIGDATYLGRAPDFADISQEASFQSPGKDDNLLQQLRNGRSSGVNLRTPRPRERGPLADRRNLPPSVGGAEFTPLLKSATRNSARRHGKENGAAVPTTPGLDRIDEDDMTPIPRMDTSMYLGSRNQSYLDNTLPQVDSSSVASTPMALQLRRGGDKGPLQDGNQLSLREQENVIDRIEKENFGLKLKIHFLEDALRKAGPGFSEAALKENTELKVDKVTMQRELQRYKKHLTSAERDLETYRQQMLELQEKAKRKHAGGHQRAELDQLQKTLDEREADIDDLQRQLDQSQHDQDEVEKLRDNIEDLEADLRERNRIITDREDQLEDLRDKLDEAENKAKDSQRRAVELEQADQQSEELEEAKDTIQDLEQNIRHLEEQLDDMKDKMAEASTQQQRAERDLEELQEEMADKSVVTKGLSRQIEEKVARLQEELDKSGKEYAGLEKELTSANNENAELQATLKELRQDRDNFELGRESDTVRVRELETELLTVADERDLLQSRHDALTKESTSLQQDVDKLEKEVEELEKNLSQEREYALEIEKDLRNQYRDEIERLNDEVSDLQAEIREKDNLYDNDSEKWENDKQTLESERERAEEKAAGLQRTIDRLRQAEGNLSDKESKLKEAIESEAERHKSEEAVMTRQIDDLQDALETRQTLLTNLRNELSTVRDELRQTQIDYQSQVNKVVALEDEVEVLQTKSSGRAGPELEAAKRECERLRGQLSELRQAADSARAANTASEHGAQQSTESMARLKWQLSDATSQLEKATKDKQSLQDQLATLNVELHSVRTSLAEARAERDELDGQLRRANSHDNDTLQVDQERLDLRTAKMKIDNEVRRLKDENKALFEQRAAVEKTLEDEIDKAAAEEERLGQEVLQLQAKLRQSSSSASHDLVAARRTIRDLQRRIEDYEAQLANVPMPDGADNSSDMSIIRRDLTASRQKELEFLQRESAHRDVVKGLRRQMAELERQLHDNEVSRLMEPPGPSPAKSNRHGGLRQQLSDAHQSIHDLRSRSREAEQMAAEATRELQRQLNDLEDQKVVLEEVLEDARQQAEETAAQHEKAMRRMQHTVDKAERDRSAATASQTEHSKHGRHLRKTQAEIENLEHDVCQQQELIDGLVTAESSLRRKLERARSERAAYRMSAEKLQRDIRRLKTAAAPQDQYALVEHRATDDALATVVRAAEGAEERHKKELRGMVMQMEWMQARWEREASLRSDAAYAKRFVQLQLDVANAWYVPDPLTLQHDVAANSPNSNKAQLRELEHIRTNLLHSRKPLVLPAPPSSGPTSTGGEAKAASIRPFLVAARFIARMRISARGWAKQEVVRRKLAAASEEQRRVKRSRQLKVVRAEVVRAEEVC
ncbi:Spindle pole body protein pcp1 [Tolypocladium ophioglossoides CBS 100239]|uniref:Spindle pole body protein pcp1 n=1 Tax=Tolypocladium ophioglossoides (strain CBS 100239) TaxID=1163406 RepID=A0A0L0NGE4_TOLOC|nr:Spindle pole body protein pcp1 [Tolypocladium ophioglossoides CBS 100239]